MRRRFILTLCDLAEADDRIVLLTGDLGFTVVEPFAERFPSRFFNVGVAEQNMVGIATGLAGSGFIPFTYSIATFATLRPYEFIRNGPALHGVPVRIVGVGGGFEYGSAGFTHHALEDLAVMRVVSGLTVIAPADHAQAANALRSTWDLPGPAYYRLGKDDTTTIAGLDGAFALNDVQQVRDGGDAVIVSTGAITREAVAAADMLAETGLDCTVLIAATISPPPIAALAERLAGFGVVTTIEAHARTGGLGSLIAEVIAERGLRSRLVRIGVDDGIRGVGGTEQYLNQRSGLTAPQIAESVRFNLEAAR